MTALPKKTEGAIRYVVFDTETTGLPDRQKVGRGPDDWRQSDASDWPELLQLTAEVWEIVDGVHTQVGETFNWWINTDKDIDPEVSGIHGITKDFLDGRGKHGKSGLHIDGGDEMPGSEKAAKMFPEIADEILAVLNDDGVDFVVAHNMPYDEWVLRKNLQGIGRDQNELNFERNGRNIVFDTTIETQIFCNLVWLNSPENAPRFKRPSLAQLYGILFPGEEIGDAHDARMDVKATVRIVQELYRRGIFDPEHILGLAKKKPVDHSKNPGAIADQWKQGSLPNGSQWEMRV